MAQVTAFRFSSLGGGPTDPDVQNATVQDDGDVVVNPIVIPAADYALVAQLVAEIPVVDNDGVVSKVVGRGSTDVTVHRLADGTLEGFTIAGLSATDIWSPEKLTDFGLGKGA